MLLNLHKKSWMEGLTLQDYSDHCKLNETIVKEMLELAKNYNKVGFFFFYYSKMFVVLTKLVINWKSRHYQRCL